MRDDPGGKWLAGYAIALGLAALLALTQTGCAKPKLAPACPAPRTITVVISCLRQPPPERPKRSGDAGIDAARLEDEYEILYRWAQHVWAACSE